jgi:hypothetical protein
MDWCVKPFDQANHPPRAVLNGEAGLAAVDVKAKAGGSITLTAKGSTDPDRQSLSYFWAVYPDAGSYRGAVANDKPEPGQVAITIPADARGKAIHVILAVSDTGKPSLTRYRRAVVRVAE